MKIDLHIERLVLEGVPLGRAEAERLRGAMVAELERILSSSLAGGELLRGGARAWVGAPSLTLQPSERPEALGSRIANCVSDGIAASAPERKSMQNKPVKGSPT